MTNILKLILFFSFMFQVSVAHAEENRHGELRNTGSIEAWDETSAKWLRPEAFWLLYAERNGGLTWGTRTEYPAYDELEEHDLMIVQLDSGRCLMEFYHQRWRRANDVRRWDPGFNEYGSCPDVFK